LGFAMYRKGSPEADCSKEPHVLVLLVTRLRAVILPQLRHVLRSDRRCPGSEARDDIIGKSRDLCIGIGAAERGHRDGMWRRFDRRPSSNRNPTNHVADLAWLEPDQREKGTVPRQVTQLVCSASYVRWDNGRQDRCPENDTCPTVPGIKPLAGVENDQSIGASLARCAMRTARRARTSKPGPLDGRGRNLGASVDRELPGEPGQTPSSR